MMRSVVCAGLATLLSMSTAARPALADTYPPNAVYVATGTSIVAIDSVTNTIRGTVPLGGPIADVAVSKDGRRVYTTHTALDRVSIIDTTTLAVAATITVGDAPTAAIVSPNGDWLYINTTGGVVQVVDTVTTTVTASIPTASLAGGSMAIAGDGSKLYLASGAVSVIDTATNTFAGSFLTGRWDIELSPDGSKAYVLRAVGGSSGAVDVVDTTTRLVTRSIGIGPPNQMAIAPDGSRLYVSLAGTFVGGGGWTGGFFLPGRFITVLDLLGYGAGAQIDVGSDTAGHLVATPDRSRVYASLGFSVAAADTSTNRVIATTAIASPGALGAGSDGSGVLVPYLIDAVDDVVASPTSGGTALASVLTNDTLGGLRPTTLHVLLTQVSSTDPKVTLDTTTGAVTVVPGAAVGPQSLEYRICERALPTNCDNAVVSLTVREPYPIDAVDDAAATHPGLIAVASVLANDTFNGATATVAVVQLTQVSSSSPTITLNTTTGAVTAAVGTPGGTHTLVYRICETASPLNCDEATVTLTVTPFPIDAVDDAAATLPGRVAVPSVLVNDTFNGAMATLATVRLTQVSTTTTAVTLNSATGAVSVALGITPGTHRLVYRICEAASPTNCDQATVTLTVSAFPIDAVDDAGTTTRSGGIAVYNVLANDSFNGAMATTAAVTLTRASSTSTMVTLNTTTGAVSVASATAIGTYKLVYKICEVTSPTNCDTATVTVRMTPYTIDAVNDFVRTYSKPTSPTIIIPSVLVNDRFAGVTATTSKVRLTTVSSTTSLITLNTTTGAVSLLSKIESAVDQYLVYRICEIANPTNCDQATVTIELTGGGGGDEPDEPDTPDEPDLP